MDQFAYEAPKQSRSERAKLRNLKRGASVSSGAERDGEDEEDISSGSNSNSDIRDDEIAEQMDLQSELSNSVIEDDQVNLNDESEESFKRGRRTTRAARSRQIGY